MFIIIYILSFFPFSFFGKTTTGYLLNIIHDGKEIVPGFVGTGPRSRSQGLRYLPVYLSADTQSRVSAFLGTCLRLSLQIGVVCLSLGAAVLHLKPDQGLGQLRS